MNATYSYLSSSFDHVQSCEDKPLLLVLLQVNSSSRYIQSHLGLRSYMAGDRNAPCNHRPPSWLFVVWWTSDRQSGLGHSECIALKKNKLGLTVSVLRIHTQSGRNGIPPLRWRVPRRPTARRTGTEDEKHLPRLDLRDESSKYIIYNKKKSKVLRCLTGSSPPHTQTKSIERASSSSLMQNVWIQSARYRIQLLVKVPSFISKVWKHPIYAAPGLLHTQALVGLVASTLKLNLHFKPNQSRFILCPNLSL